jgi:hypothetical protein
VQELHREKRWLLRYKLLFGIAFLLVCSSLGLDTYYDYTCPIVANEQTKHIYSRFDKHHDRYVYLTRAEDYSIPIVMVVAMGFGFAAFVVGQQIRKLNRQVPSNETINPARNGQAADA